MKTNGGISKTVFAVLIGLSSIFTTSSIAQSVFNDNYLVSYISMSEGLPANFVDYIYKDSSGFIWIATSGGGLSRYDGNEFLTLTTHSTPALRSNFITCVTEDHFHRLWIASENGLDILDLETLGCDAISIQELKDAENRIIRFITTDANGNIWLKYGIYIYRISFFQNGNIKDVLTFSDPRIGLQDNFIRDVEGDGSVWTCFGSKMIKLQAADGAITSKTVISDLPIEANAYVSDCILKNNEVWISSDGGLVRYNRTSGKLRHYQHSDNDDSTLSQNFLTALSIDSEDQLLVSSLKGINIYDSFNDSFERINSDGEGELKNVLSSDFINCISSFDEQIWIGTESAGIVVISPKLLAIKNFRHDGNRPGSIAPNPVNTILADDEGRIWTGNVEAGLSWSYPGSGVFHHFTTSNSSLVHNSVSALECDRKGNLWVGTWGGGISILSLKDMTFTGSITASTDIPISFIGILKYDPVNNYMWIGSNTGVFVYDPSSGDIRPVLKDQPFGSIGACVDEKGRMWLGCQEGLYVFDLYSRNDDNGNDMFANRIISPGATDSDRINCVSITSDGTLWVGSNGNGIYRLDSDNGEMQFTRFSTEQGLANDRVKGILDDNYGNIWISTDNGLSRLNPHTLVFTNYSTANGLASSQFYWNASTRMPDGTLYFGQTNGLTVVTPAQEYENGRKYSLRFTRLTIGERDIHAGDRHTDRDITFADRIRLHEKDRSIGLEFALLDYGAASPATYSYRLKGFDNEWITLRQNRQFVSFANLPAGSYTLQVRATNSDAVILGEDEMTISVTGYFYKSWWFGLLMAIFVIVAVFVFVRLRTRHLSRQREELQKTVMERTREISEQKKLLELKAEELASQNRILTRQNEELAGHRILFSQEIRQAENQNQKDDRFVEKAIETIRENYKNPNLDVTEFCSAMGMSKTLVNNRLQESLGQSIGQFIRAYRLSIAREMLINNRESRNMNISEIAYEVGFNDPKYFTRCFTKEYGVAPSSLSK